MKILWVKSDFLYPADTGGKIRSYNILRELCRQHEVSYLCLSDETPEAKHVNHMRQMCDKVEVIPFKPDKKFSPGFYLKLISNLLSQRPYVINKYKNPQISSKIKEYISTNQVDVIVCDFLEMAVNLLDITEVPKVLFQHNVETEIWRRHYEITENLLKKSYLYIDYQKFYKFEKLACSYFDDILVVSESDAELLRKSFRAKQTTLIPTGVDIEYYNPREDLMEPDNIVFVGSMDWLPNQDAIKFFIDDIYPKVKSVRPNVKFYIVGRRPPAVIKNLEKYDNSITVTGTVEDIRGFVDKAQVYVVPIRIGGGTRIKIFEAMAQKKAIVSTTVGAEGLPVEDSRHILLRDSPSEFADTICRVMSEDKLRDRIGRNGYKLVTEKYSWEKIAINFSNALEKVINNRRTKIPAGDISGES